MNVTWIVTLLFFPQEKVIEVLTALKLAEKRAIKSLVGFAVLSLVRRRLMSCPLVA